VPRALLQRTGRRNGYPRIVVTPTPRTAAEHRIEYLKPRPGRRTGPIPTPQSHKRRVLKPRSNCFQESGFLRDCKRSDASAPPHAEAKCINEYMKLRPGRRTGTSQRRNRAKGQFQNCYQVKMLLEIRIFARVQAVRRIGGAARRSGVYERIHDASTGPAHRHDPNAAIAQKDEFLNLSQIASRNQDFCASARRDRAQKRSVYANT